ncbi:MAG TPA: glycosyltransferase family 2 protein [Patescibacteria group bacterium]|nr:glycosyltransferase family 2 protein [Patescibacteria group bacterium]
MFISVVIPTYNGENHLQKNLPQVIAALTQDNQKDIELILTDDHSTDSTVDILKKIQKNSPIPVTILENAQNGGFSINVNRGVRAAKGDIVILLGSDVLPGKNFIQPLLAHFNDEKVFAVGCANKSDQDKGTNILRGRGIGKWEKGFLFHFYGELINDNTLWVDCGSGAFRKSIWDKIGGLEELYRPFYWEDIDISYRAQKMGYTVKIEKKSVVIHEHEKGSIKKLTSSLITQTAYRNQFFFVWLNITDRNLLINHLFYIPYHLLSALKNRNWLLIKGFIKALSQLGKVRIARKKITPRFCVNDKAILAKFTNEI